MNDAIIPTLYEIPVGNVTLLSTELNGEYDEYVDSELAKAQKISDAAGDGVVVGKLFRSQVADGYAWYVVTKVAKKTCMVEWRGFCLDRWHDQFLGSGGSFKITMIEPAIRRADGMKKLFTKQGT